MKQRVAWRHWDARWVVVARQLKHLPRRSKGTSQRGERICRRSRYRAALDLTTCHPSSLERTLLEAFHWRRQEGMEALTAIPGHFGSSRTEPAGGASTAVVLRSASLKVPGMAAGNSSPYDPTRGLHEDEPPPIQAGLTSA
jgi:hypothetical protein